MSFKEVASLDADVTIAIGKKDKQGKPFPKSAEGYYLGSRKVANKRGESTLHFLQTPKGNLGVWGTTDLDRKLLQADTGTMVRITSTGTKPTPNGDMYTYKVEFDADNTIEVLATLSEGYGASTNDSSDEDTAYVADTSNEEEGFDEDEAQQAALLAAEKKAKVQALLNRGANKNKN